MSTLQIVAPVTLHKEVLAAVGHLFKIDKTELHECAVGGRFEIDKTLTHLKQQLYWPGNHNNVQDWCASCVTCAAQKKPSPNITEKYFNRLTPTDGSSGHC